LEWHPAQDESAFIGAWGAWQLVQTVCAGTVVAARVVFSPWQPMHARSPPATKS
jgi:hypothetical protein